MTLIDDRGRLFGRLNLVDAAAVAFVVLLLPIAYGMWLLFHPRKVQITSVTLVHLTKDEQRIANPLRAAAKLKVKGRQFTPMLRAWIGTEPALGFMFEDPNSADVIVAPMSPGEYDVLLYDGGMEVARAPRAYRVAARETRDKITAVGRLLDLDQATADKLAVGAQFPSATDPMVRIAGLGIVRPGRYPVIAASRNGPEVPRSGTFERAASLELACDRAQPDACAINSLLVAPNVVMRLPGPIDTMTFIVDEVLPGSPAEPLDVVVQFGGGPEAGLIAAGDRDQLADDRAAVVTSIGRQVHLRVGADLAHDGWRYRNRPLKVGSPFTLTTEKYVANGIVASATPIAGGNGRD